MLLSRAISKGMKTLQDFNHDKIQVLLCDIDGTLTSKGRLPASSYVGLDRLQQAGIKVIPVTGRPAGWCELIARLWPVHGVVGENGAFYFRYDGQKMRRQFARSRPQRKKDRHALKAIRDEVLTSVAGSAIASDQFCRLFDLAIDFCEDVEPLKSSDVKKIVKIFTSHGAQAKVSNIHVNGWFGTHDKLSTCKTYLKREFGFSEVQMREHCAFVGDSPNDEPMFEFFPHSFAVANIKEFWDQLKHHPAYVTTSEEAKGFCELADRLMIR